MKPAEKAMRYAKQHPQEVTLAWIDNSTRTYTADKALENMLNNLLDDE